MIFLRWLNAGLLLFGLSMMVTLGVVCILYAFYLDSEPRLREDWPALVSATLMFAGLSLAAAIAFRGLLRDASWKWAGQALLLGTVAFLSFQLSQALT